MITRLEATNYRCFDQLDVDLNEFMVLVGANGSGKTTLLDIPVLMGQLLASRNISTAFLERSGNRAPRATGLRDLLHRDLGDTFILAVEAKLPDGIALALGNPSKGLATSGRGRGITHVRYEIRLNVDGRSLLVQNENLIAFTLDDRYQATRLRLQGENAASRDWRFILRREPGKDVEFRPERRARLRKAEVDDTVLALPRVLFESDKDFPAARWLYRLLVEGTVYYNPDWEALRMASPPGLPRKVIASAVNLPWIALELSRDDPERFGDWIEHVRVALPQIETISVKERDDDHHAYFVVKYAGGYTVTSSGLSDGTLRVMALTILPYLRDLPPVLVTEEPENGIHPRAIEMVLQSLSSMYDSQVWISSHSPVVLAHVKLSQVLCTRLEQAGTAAVVPGLKHPRLVDWKGTIDLGSLFAAGVLG